MLEHRRRGRGSRRGTRRSAGWLAATVAATVALSGCSSSDSPGFVTRSGASFLVGGQPFRFVGFNIYDAAASDIYSCSPQTRLDDTALAETMAYVRDEAGATVVRFWAYQTYTAGGTDFTGMDRVVAAARKAGLRVMPVLEDGPGNCSTGRLGEALGDANRGTWYTDGYKHPYGNALVSYRDYVRVVADHYRDDPTILGWTMVNEAETTRRDGADRSVLVAFAADIAEVIHGVDRRHLVTLGTQGNGAPGGSGKDFADIYGQPGLDFTEVHDWNRYGSDTEPLPGSVNGALPDADAGDCQRTDSKIACSFVIARTLDKPLVVGEAGVEATDANARTRRAGLLDAKMQAAFAAGASGYLVWHLDRGHTDKLDVIPAEQDPLVPVMARTAAHLDGRAIGGDNNSDMSDG